MAAITVRQAQPADAAVVQDMLEEAARWVDALGVVMWDEGELAPGRVDSEIAAGQFFIAEVNGDPAGAVKFQLEDRLFWPDLTEPMIPRSFIVSSCAGVTKGLACRQL